MAMPTQKAVGIEEFIDSITPNKLGRAGSIKADVCTWCGRPATSFKDRLSEKEYQISGFCQECQDETFG